MIDKEAGMSTKERMGEEIATLAARIDAATYELLVLIRKFDEEEGWNCGFLSCAQWLSWRIGLAPGAAREKVRVARALGELPLMSEAMKRGQLSYSKVRALTRIARPDTEKDLVELGRAGTAAYIERVVRSWRRIDRSVEAADDELRDASSHVTTHIDENGMFVIRGRLAPEAGEVLMKALKAAGEKLYAEQQGDRPPAGKVRADALALIAESALKGGLDPGSSGDRYQVVVHVSDEELRAREAVPEVGCASCVSAETAAAHVSAGTPPTRPQHQPAARAEAEHVPAETPTSLQPRRGRSSPRGAWLGDSHVPVSAETARRIACDAGKVRITHRSGQILSVGRKTRTIPPPIRRALEFRDQGCRFPGCTSKHCDAHHIVHWADGGETKLSNLMLLCRRHHRLLHEGGFSVRMSEEGAVQFFHRRGRPLEESPAPPPVGLRAARELVEHLENAGILITGKESMPTWDGRPLDLPYVMECLWKPPPHLEAKVAREQETPRAA
ncbi:MAG: DUF222 domain-containing protein [Holophagales bacterium]|nr:DUF222 domain-containing protein [Holophagales bacterium]MYH23856.1 DUF222 domain-containing protein [Holophagales bacterium]